MNVHEAKRILEMLSTTNEWNSFFKNAHNTSRSYWAEQIRRLAFYAEKSEWSVDDEMISAYLQAWITSRGIYINELSDEDKEHLSKKYYSADSPIIGAIPPPSDIFALDVFRVLLILLPALPTIYVTINSKSFGILLDSIILKARNLLLSKEDQLHILLETREKEGNRENLALSQDQIKKLSKKQQFELMKGFLDSYKKK